ncbi:phosphotransferase family protein [Anaerosporobacter faecicola]|uniref:phosphotransferase family protein n=1 Tax=Anaerosporobacter faecicola TaxID=2718714 RepID=UPI00143904A2|nr:aminoglycoside phosphotransferase family protein [Anaerosporobacter faecicola]
MNAVSKFWQTDDTLMKMTQQAIGEPLQTFSAKPLDGGFCNAVYLITANGEDMVLKIAPHEAIEMLSDEKNLLKNEAEMLTFVNEMIHVPIPKVLLYDTSCSICKSPYLFITKIAGVSMDKINQELTNEERNGILEETGKITAAMNAIKGTTFGRPQMPETFTKSNSEFMLGVYKLLIQDGKAKDFTLPCISYDDLWDLLCANKDAFDDCKEPCLIHNDIWDGNMMIHDHKLSGIIDFERCFWGDYLLEDHFSGYGEISPAFLKGYGKSSFTKMEERRICLYRIWRRLAMTIEIPYRQFEDDGRYQWVTGELSSQIAHLQTIM